MSDPLKDEILHMKPKHVLVDMIHERNRSILKYLEASSVEIAKLKAELEEAREIITALTVVVKPADGVWLNLDIHKNDLKRARAFLDKAGK